MRLLLAGAALGAVLAVEHRAVADGPRVHARLGVSDAVGSDDFGVGGMGALSAELPLVSILSAQADVGTVLISPKDPAPGKPKHSLGTVTFAQLGPRFHVSGLWLSLGAGIAFTGSDTRFGAGGALGWDFLLGTGRFGVGPFVGYTEVLETGAGDDAHLLSGGVQVTFGAPAKAEPPPPPPAIPDADGDGVPDSEDACPNVKGVHTNDLNTNGCPPKDTDNDGVPDDEDACPNLPGVRRADPRMNGCPDVLPPKEPPPDLDRDGDGIPDSVDACPDTPGKPSPDPKKNGCPPPADMELD